MGKPRINRDPLDQVTCYIPCSDMACVDAVARKRKVPPSAVMREAVAEWIRTHANEILEVA